MSTWIKINDDLFGREPDEDPVEVVSISELEAEIIALQENITQAESNLIEVPKGVEERVVNLINQENQKVFMIDIIPMQLNLDNKKKILTELKSI